MCNNFNELVDAINQIVERAKQMALNRYGQNHSKQDIISDTVATFVLDNIQQIKPRPKLFKNMLAGKHVSINMVLDSIGENGVLIGATAFRIAEQLELELPGNEVESKDKSVVPCINGQFRLELCANDIDISAAYYKYFKEHSLSLFLQNLYWYHVIEDTSPDPDSIKLKKAICYIQLQTLCDDLLILSFVHETLKLLYSKDSITADIEILHAFKESCEERLKNSIDNDSDEEQQKILLYLAGLSAAISQIEEIMQVC